MKFSLRLGSLLGIAAWLGACSGTNPWFEPVSEAPKRSKHANLFLLAAGGGLLADVGRIDAVTGSLTVTSLDGTKHANVGTDYTLQNEDTLVTGPGSSCTISFLDGSTFGLAANTTVTINQRTLAEEVEGKKLGRRLELANGRIDFDVKHNENVLTSVWNKTGLVEIFGSNGVVDAATNSLGHTLQSGRSRIRNPNIQISFDVAPGQTVTFTLDLLTGEVAVGVNDTNPTPRGLGGRIGNEAVEIDRETRIAAKREADAAERARDDAKAAKKAADEADQALKKAEDAKKKADDSGKPEDKKAADDSKKDAEDKSKAADNAKAKADDSIKKADDTAAGDVKRSPVEKKAEADQRAADKADLDAKKADRGVRTGGMRLSSASSAAVQAEKHVGDSDKKAKEAEKKADDAGKKAVDADKKAADADKKAADAQKKADDAQKKADDAKKEADKETDPAKKAKKEADADKAKKDADGAKKDADGAKKDADSAKKDADNAKKEVDNAKKDTDAAKKDFEKKAADADKAKADAAKTEKDVAKGPKGDVEVKIIGGKILVKNPATGQFEEKSGTFKCKADDRGHGDAFNSKGGVWGRDQEAAFLKGKSLFLTEEELAKLLSGELTIDQILQNLRTEATVNAAFTLNFALAFIDSLHDDWHQDFDNNPSFFGSSAYSEAHSHFHAAIDSAKSHLAAAYGGNPIDSHEFTHALLDLDHIAFHLGDDDDRLFFPSSFSSEHSSIESDLLNLHNALHLSEHDFLHAVMDTFHNRFHREHPSLPPGSIEEADHNDLHADLDTIHAQLHNAGTHGALHAVLDIIHDDFHREHPNMTEAEHNEFHTIENQIHDQVHVIYGIPK